MVCPNCGAVHSLSDNFCRRCGWNISGTNVPAVIEDKERGIAPYEAERAVAIGSVATVAVGALAWLAKRWLAHKMTDTAPRNLPAVVSKAQPPARREQSQPTRRTAESEHMHVESYVWIRRITTFRREQD